MFFYNPINPYATRNEHRSKRSPIRLTETYLAFELPIGAIKEMYYDYRKTDSWKCVNPPSHFYKTAPEILREYRKEYADKLKGQLHLF